MRNNRNVLIEWGGRKWSHQQIHGLMRAIGEMGEIRLACHWGCWRVNLHHGALNAVSHGKTPWLAIKDAIDRATANAWVCGAQRPHHPFVGDSVREG
jgi:hypothetical protein